MRNGVGDVCKSMIWSPLALHTKNKTTTTTTVSTTVTTVSTAIPADVLWRPPSETQKAWAESAMKLWPERKTEGWWKLIEERVLERWGKCRRKGLGGKNAGRGETMETWQSLSDWLGCWEEKEARQSTTKMAWWNLSPQGGKTLKLLHPIEDTGATCPRSSLMKGSEKQGCQTTEPLPWRCSFILSVTQIH